MRSLLSRLYERLKGRYFWVYVAFDAWSAAMICLGTVGLFALYTKMSATEFWAVVAFAEAWTAVGLLYGFLKARRLAKPLIEWVDGGRPAEGAFAAWRAAVSLPRSFVMANGWQPFVLIALPVSAFIVLYLNLPFWSMAVVFAGTVVAVAYAAVLHFFASESFLRPVVEDAARRLPADFAGRQEGVPLRWKLLGALPLINVITGVVVSGLSTNGTASVKDLGIDVLVAVVVAFTISFELTVLVTKSVLRPVDDLLEATNRVKEGDLSARVPVTSGDEIGVLAGSFNEMMHAVSEREALHEAFGSYVDPGVAERVLAEGELLEGHEAEVTLLVVDIRDFTPFAERSSARETVAHLNDFFDAVVPIVLKHGGHANKFLGDGLLAVFGTPEPYSDHADRALAAACELADQIERRFDGEVGFGVGLNSGPVAVGSVGGGGRLEFGVIGDPVNVAARVEACTRKTGDTVLLTEATRCLLERSEVELVPRDELPLKGKSEPVRLYAPQVLDQIAPDLDGRPSAATQRLAADA
jgi:adenylate cyclase